MRTVGSSEESNPIVSCLSEIIIILEGIAEHICSVTFNEGEESTNLIYDFATLIQKFICSIFSSIAFTIFLANEWMKSFLVL